MTLPSKLPDAVCDPETEVTVTSGATEALSAAISDEPDTVFARRITMDHGVAAISPSVIYHQGNDYRVLRFCFAKDDATLKEAAEALCRI